MISNLTFMSKLVLLFVITLSLADNLKDIEEVGTVEIGSKSRLSEFYNSITARRNLGLPSHAVVDFPFDHQCVSSKKDRQDLWEQAWDELSSSTSVGQKAIKTFLQMIEDFDPLKTMCLGNLGASDFESMKNSDSSMETLGCNYLEEITKGNNLSNLAFSVKDGSSKPGFCSTVSTYSSNPTFQMAFDKSMIDTIVDEIPNIGKLLSGVSTSQVAFGISKGGYIAKTFTYWKDYERSNTLGAHAMLKMNVVLDPVLMVEKFFEDYIDRVGDLPTNFITLSGDVEMYARFYQADSAINCIFGASSCTESDASNYLFNNKFYLTGTGTLDIDFSKMVGVLPKVSVDLKDAHVYRDNSGIYFKWVMNDIKSVLGEFLDETIGKMDGLPSIKSEEVEFEAYIDEDGFGFQGEYMTNQLKCAVDFNVNDPVHCEYDNRYFSIIMETVDDIADAAKAVYMETKEWAEDTGDVIAAGASAAVEEGAKVVDGVTKGVISAADSVSNEIEAILGNTKDWCDCNQKGKLKVWASGTDTYELDDSSNWQMIVWGKKVTSVSWKCSDGGSTQKAYFSDGGSTWMVKFEHEWKTCYEGNDIFPGSYGTGRIYWK